GRLVQVQRRSVPAAVEVDGWDAGQAVQEVATDLLDALGGNGFEAGGERRLGIGGADESPAAVERDARAIEVDDAAHARVVAELVEQLLDDAELLFIGAVEALLGRGDVPG